MLSFLWRYDLNCPLGALLVLAQATLTTSKTLSNTFCILYPSLLTAQGEMTPHNFLGLLYYPGKVTWTLMIRKIKAEIDK